MSPSRGKASGRQKGGKGRRSLVPLATVISRLDDAFEEPLVRAALLPGYAEYELALSEIDGWPTTGENLVLLKCGEGEDERWSPVANLYVLAAAKKVGKADVPCFFIVKDEVPLCVATNVGAGLKQPAGTSDEDEEEAFFRAFWR